MICRNAFALFALVQLGRSARWSPTKAMLRARPLAKSAALRGGGLVDWGSGSAANAKPRDADATGTSEELYEAYNLLHRLARDFKKVRAALPRSERDALSRPRAKPPRARRSA